MLAAKSMSNRQHQKWQKKNEIEEKKKEEERVFKAQALGFVRYHVLFST
jgi:hypothetical protein